MRKNSFQNRMMAFGMALGLVMMSPVEALAASDDASSTADMYEMLEKIGIPDVVIHKNPLYGEEKSDANGLDANGKPVALTDAEWAALNDTTIELNEIENLVKYKSVLGKTEQALMTNSTASMNQVAQAARDMISDVKDEIATLKDDRNSASSETDKIKDTILITAFEKSIETGTILPTIRNTFDNLSNKTTSTVKGSIYPTEKTMSAGMETLFYSIKALEPTVQMLTKMRDTYQASYDTAVRQQASGLGTALSVSEAQANRDNAANQLASVSETVRKLKTTLALSLGYSMADAQNVALGDTLPEYDSTYAATRIFESDLATAKTNCYSYSQAWQTNRKSDASLTGYTAEDIDWNSQLQAIGMNMTNLYSDLQSSAQQVEAANLDFQIAEKQKGSAERSYAAGMIGYPQYLGAQIQYLKSEAAAATAKIDALKTQNAYNWALRGVFS